MTLKSRHRLRHERRVLVQVPVGVVEMSVPKICGQRGQPALGVCASAIASAQHLDRHSVSQIMQTRPGGVRDAAHPELPGQSQERPIQNSRDNSTSERRYEEWLGNPARQESIALVPVSFQHIAGRRVNRDQSGFSELRVTYGENALVEIDIFKVKVDGFTDSHPGDAEQAEDCIMGPARDRFGTPPPLQFWPPERLLFHLR